MNKKLLFGIAFLCAMSAGVVCGDEAPGHFRSEDHPMPQPLAGLMYLQTPREVTPGIVAGEERVGRLFFEGPGFQDDPSDPNYPDLETGFLGADQPFSLRLRPEQELANLMGASFEDVQQEYRAFSLAELDSVIRDIRAEREIQLDFYYE